MPQSLSLYTFEDRDGNEADSFTTQDPDEARKYGAENKLRVIDNVYEWSEAVPVEGQDFTEPEEEDEEPDPAVIVLFRGEHESQEYWESEEGPKLALIRNKAEQHWWPYWRGRVLDDEAALAAAKARNPAVHSVLVSAPTADAVARQFEKITGIEVRFAHTRPHRPAPTPPEEEED